MAHRDIRAVVLDKAEQVQIEGHGASVVQLDALDVALAFEQWTDVGQVSRVGLVAREISFAQKQVATADDTNGRQCVDDIPHVAGVFETPHATSFKIESNWSTAFSQVNCRARAAESTPNSAASRRSR